MSNVDENEDGSDEDMFSPKKNRCKIEITVAEPVNHSPGCKERLVNTFKRMLTGVPPPPDYTNPDFHLDKMLTHWKENQNLVWDRGSSSSHGSAEENQSTLGICLNTDDSCEELELLGRQICERYIWSETSAVTSCAYVKLTQSAKKRRKANGWGMSPRTRISYLTRRMTTFQKGNIASAVASNKATQILIAKNDCKKGSAGKCNSKGKRALFQSPENQNKYSTPEQGKDRRLVRRLLLNSSPQGNDKSRCNSGGETAKSLEKRRCSRSLFSSKTEQVSYQPSMPQNQSQQSNALSTQHRQKMLWAVSNALKAVKIRMTDSEFKTYAGPLFKATTEKWRASLNSPAGDKKVSTSDAMLAAAKSLVEGITGRKMSPKSAKKNPTPRRTKTPDKSGRRDENNPPSVADPATPISSLAKDSGDGGVFPLEHVGVLAEKLDPGGNTYSSIIQTANPSRKRKLEDDRDFESPSILVSPRVLRMRTPSKISGITPKKLQFHPSVVDGTPSKQSNDSPLTKKRKSGTPTKAEPSTSHSPRVLRTRTPSKLESDVQNRSPMKSHSSPLKLLTVNGNVVKNSTTPTKSQNDDVEVLVWPRVLRTRTPSKTPESPKAISQQETPIKLRSTPSKQPSQLKNLETCAESVVTPAKFDKEIKGILLSPRGFLTRTQSQAVQSPENCRSKRTPRKVLLAPSDGKDGDSSNQEISPNSKNGDKGTLDPLPPVLRVENVALRRSSRKSSAEYAPPVLTREISNSSPPPLSLER